MLANLFRKTKIISLSLGAFLIFLVFVFYHNGAALLSQNTVGLWSDSALKTAFLVLALGNLMWLEGRYRHLKIVPLHSLSFALVLLYLPQGSVGVPGLLTLFFLGIVLHYLSLTLQIENTIKSLFNLSLILSGLVVFEPLFVCFFISPALFFLDKRFQNSKHLLAFILPIVITFICAGTLFHFFQSEYSFQSTNTGNFIGIKNLGKDVILLILLGLIAILFPLKNEVRKGVTSNPAAHLFLITWFILGLYISFTGGTSNLNPWEMLFFPLAHLTGIFLKEITNRALNIFILTLIFLKVFSLYFLT